MPHDLAGAQKSKLDAGAEVAPTSLWDWSPSNRKARG